MTDRRRLWTVGLALVGLFAGIAALLASPADAIVLDGFFVDDNDSVFEGDIDSIAFADITKGCNPPANTNYCPDLPVDRGAMAAFLDRALGLPPSNTDHFIDDNNSIFEGSINSLADAGITKGCNPPTNNRYCPTSPVDRGAMAAFLRRALNLPAYIIQIPMSDDSVVSCSKDGERCDVTVDLKANRNYAVEEGVFNVLPYGPGEQADFIGGTTFFTLVKNGSNLTLTELPLESTSSDVTRPWTTNVSFSAGQHQLVGRWTIDGQLILTTFVTINAD